MNIRNLPNSQLQNLLRIQFELYQIEKISSFYTEILTFLVQYSFIFDESPTKIKTLTQDPARDGSNWYGYCGQNPINRYDPSGLNWMDREGNWHSNSEPGINYNVGDETTSGPQGETGPTETPKVPETSALPNDISTSSNLSGYHEENDNPFITEPDDTYYQNSDELKYILENFDSNGCNFMAYLFMVQDYTGHKFTALEIQGLAEYLMNTPNKSPNAKNGEMCMVYDDGDKLTNRDSNYYDVRNPDVLMNKAFEIAGHPKLWATAGWGKEKGQTADYTNITVRTILNNIHHVTGDSQGNIIYNPYKGSTIRSVIEIKEVYIHGEW